MCLRAFADVLTCPHLFRPDVSTSVAGNEDEPSPPSRKKVSVRSLLRVFVYFLFAHALVASSAGERSRRLLPVSLPDLVHHVDSGHVS